MVSDETHQRVTQELSDYLVRIRDGIPQLTGIIDAFEDLLIKKLISKFQLSTQVFPESDIDFLRFSKGVPVLADRKMEIDKDSLQQVARLLIPAMKKGFPKLDVCLDRLESFISTGEMTLDRLRSALESGSPKILNNLAAELGVSSAELQFVSSELAKPFVEKVAETISPIIENLDWLKGYCPVCGGWPGVSCWKGPEGLRFLNCSVCGHQWSYMRTQCPFCENSDNAELEIIFCDDRKFEHGELCHACKKYIVGLDTRHLIYPLHLSAAALGLIYLDFLAQERGFTPGATYPWNILQGV